ncbi:phenol hydroxylase [Rhizobium sp. Pop5]|nr:phenol hydroxylase [Rhizobium sp. Pop5]
MVERHRRPFLCHHALVQHHDTIRHRHRLHLVVGDVNDGRLQLAVQALQLRAHLHAERRIEVRQRLVEQDQRRLLDDGPADRHALALAAGKSGRTAVEIVGELQDLGDPFHLPADFRPRHLLQAEGETDVFGNAHMRIERIGLEHHGNAAFVGRHIVDALAIEDKITLVDAFKAGDHAQQRRLATSGRTDEDGEFPVFHRDVDAFDDLERTVEFANVSEIDHPFLFLISALHAARERLDEEAPRKAEGDDGGQQVDEGERRQQAVVDLVDAQEGAEETERQRLQLRRRQEDQRQQEVAPGRHEGEEPGGRQPRQRQRDQHPADALDERRPVHQRRLFVVPRQAVEEGLHDPERQRQLHRRQHQDQAEIAVDEAGPAHDVARIAAEDRPQHCRFGIVQRQQELVERHDEGRRRQHPDEQDRIEERQLPPGPGARQRITAEPGKYHDQQRGAADHEERVEQPLRSVLLGEDPDIIGEGPLLRPMEKKLRIAVKRGEQHPEERHGAENRDQRQGRIGDEVGTALVCAFARGNDGHLRPPPSWLAHRRCPGSARSRARRRRPRRHIPAGTP